MSTGVSEGGDNRRGWLAAGVFFLDARLRRWQNVYEYDDDPACLFRLQNTKADQDFRLSDGTHVAPGDPLLTLHVWNEHVPVMGAEGPDLAWARQLGRQIDRSLRLLSRYLDENRTAYGMVDAICADMSLGPSAHKAKIGRLAGRFGFEWVREASAKGGRLHQLGENILMLLLVAASNPAALKSTVLWREHTIAFLSRRILARRYGARVPDNSYTAKEHVGC